MSYAEGMNPATQLSGGVQLSESIGRVSAPLREQVLNVLRQAILTFQLQPGQRLIERELIESTGVSRTTIREALRELAAEGLVTTLPQKGAIVASPTVEEAEELYEIRSALESLMVARFVENASEDQVAELRHALDEVAAVVEGGGDALANLKAKDAFYDVLGEGAGNQALRATLTQIQAKVSLLRATSLNSSPERPRQALEELQTIMGAIESRDKRAAEKASRKHLQNAKEAGIKALRAQV